MSSRTLVTALLLTAATLAGIYLFFFQLSQLFAITFAAVLVAVALDVPTTLLRTRLHLPRSLALIVLALLAFAFWAGLGAWIGPQVVSQFSDLESQVGRGLQSAQRWFSTNEPFRSLLRLAPPPTEVAPRARELIQGTQQALVSGFGLLADLLIMIFVGLFLAANPGRYSGGLLLLLPQERRAHGSRVLAAIAQALRWWLVARFILMALVGTLFGVGLWILDVPLALPLAVVAMLLTFIPYVGPVLAYIPILAVALLEGAQTALYVTVLYVVVQAIESYVAEPLIEARTVTLPPALIVLAQVLCVVWLGFVGVLLATPLLVTAVVMVQILYVQSMLGEDIVVAGQR